MLGYSQAAANAAAAASAGGRLVNPSSIEESNPSPSVAVLGASATDTGGDHSRSISFSAGRHSSSKTYLWLKSNFHKKPTFGKVLPIIIDLVLVHCIGGLARQI